MRTRIFIAAILGCAAASVYAAPKAKPAAKPAAKTPQAKPKNAVPPGMMVAPFELPTHRWRGVSRGPVFLPKGAKNAALNCDVTSSHKPSANGGDLTQVVDGVKASFYGNGARLMIPNYVGAPKVTPWVQVNLQSSFVIHGVLIWHNFFEPQTYKDVIVQLSDDRDFKTGVRTVFNNDSDNSAGLGHGTDKEYLEDFQGHWIPIKAQNATYVRIYGKDKWNSSCEYAEIEVWSTTLPIPPGMEPAKFEYPSAPYLG